MRYICQTMHDGGRTCSLRLPNQITAGSKLLLDQKCAVAVCVTWTTNKNKVVFRALLQWSLLQAEAGTAAVVLQEFGLDAPSWWVPMLGKAGQNKALDAPNTENGVREKFLDNSWESRRRGGGKCQCAFHPVSSLMSCHIEETLSSSLLPWLKREKTCNWLIYVQLVVFQNRFSFSRATFWDSNWISVPWWEDIE